MSEFVRLRDCQCPGTPHEEGDGVYLRPTLSLEAGLLAEQAINEMQRLFPLPDKADAATSDRIQTERTYWLRPKWFDLFLRHGAAGWNLMGEDGDIPFDIEALLGDYSLARVAAEAANDRYSDAVLAPFQIPPAKPSRNGRTGGGIHPPAARTRSPSRPSSLVASGDGLPSAAQGL